MRKFYDPILITGLPSSGKTTILNAFTNFSNECNVIDVDQYGEWRYDLVEKQANWFVHVSDIKLAVDRLRDKPIIIVGVCNNISDLINLCKYSSIYLIDHNPEEVADRLNLRYEKSGCKEKTFWQMIYGLERHNANSVNRIFATLENDIWKHKSDLGIVKMPVMKIVADVALTIDKSKKMKMTDCKLSKIKRILFS